MALAEAFAGLLSLIGVELAVAVLVETLEDALAPLASTSLAAFAVTATLAVTTAFAITTALTESFPGLLALIGVELAIAVLVELLQEALAHLASTSLAVAILGPGAVRS